jgi:hypothetical protein
MEREDRTCTSATAASGWWTADSCRSGAFSATSVELKHFGSKLWEWRFAAADAEKSVQLEQTEFAV